VRAHVQWPLFSSTSSTMSDSARKLDIAIVGAGLAGLAAATSCALGGHNVTVYEGAKHLAEIGAGLQITPNASRLLSQWGLLEKAEAVCAEPTRIAVHRYADGAIILDDPQFKANVRRRYGDHAPFIDMHRIDLQTMLYNRAVELGVSVRFNSKVMEVQQHEENPVITLENESCQHHLIIGADGLWSKCRSFLLGHASDPEPTGDLAYRIILTLDQLTSDPELHAWVSNPQCHFWTGPSSHAVGYSVRNGTNFNLVLLVPDDLPPDVQRQPGSTQELRTLFKDWDPILTRFLDHVETVDKWKLMHRKELETWVNDKGTFVLIGDASHNMLPYLAQGANSALEDGAVLGALLSHVNTGSSTSLTLKEAMQTFESLRKPRSEAIARETVLQRHLFHLPDGDEQRQRDAAFAKQMKGEKVEGNFVSRWTDLDAMGWLLGYDAYAEVERVLKER
jgi:salicylate hydroxylase